MRPEREYRRKAITALDVIQIIANTRKDTWKGRTPPSMQEVDEAIRRLSYCVGTLKDYRSIRIQMEKEDAE